MADLVPLPNDYRRFKARIEEIESRLNALSGRRLQVSSMTTGTLEIKGDARLLVHDGGGIEVGAGGGMQILDAGLTDVPPMQQVEIINQRAASIPLGQDWATTAQAVLFAPQWASAYELFATFNISLSVTDEFDPGLAQLRVGAGEDAGIGQGLCVGKGQATGSASVAKAAQIAVPEAGLPEMGAQVKVSGQTRIGNTQFVQPEQSIASLSGVIVWKR